MSIIYLNAMSVIQTKSWNVNWFKNKGDVMSVLPIEQRAEAVAIKNCPADCVVVKSETKKWGSMWGAVSPAKLLDLICENRGLYEITHKFPHKVYFDIDKQGNEPDFLDKIKTAILKYFPNANFAISGSYTETKISFHITLTNYVIHNVDEQRLVKHIVRYMHNHEDPAFDWVVYRKGNMKAVNQSKPDGRIQALLENPDLKTHLITCFLPEYPLPFQEPPQEIKEHIAIEKDKGTFDVLTLPKLNLTVPSGVVWLDIQAEQALRLLPAEQLNHEHARQVARFCKTEGISLEKFLKWNSAKWEHRKYSPSLTSEKIRYWRLVWNSPYVSVPFTLEQLKQTFLKHFYKDIAKDVHYARFEKTFDLPQDCITKIDRLSQNEFNGTEKATIINIGMGGGKTAQTCDFLQNEQSFCWIAPNRALAHNTFYRLEESNIYDLKHYSHEPTKDKKEKSLMHYNKMVIVLNSLHYLFEKTYRVIVLDEIETIIDKWFGNFMANPIKQNNWNVFCNLLRRAEKLILLDAFITTKTIRLITSICPNIEYRIYERNVEPITRAVHYNNDFALCVRQMIDDLRNGLKLFIFYPYKNHSRSDSKYVSMEAFYHMLVSETGKRGEHYNGDVDDKVKLGLRNVNITWSDLDFVITNMVITCGVNYDKTDFDKEYIFCTSFTSPRDAVQVSYRPRTLNTNQIVCCFLGKMTQTNAWEVDTEIIPDPVYSQMIDSILIERKSPIRKTLQLFFDKAHYSQHMHRDKIQESIGHEITEMLEKYGAQYTFGNIPDIDFSVADSINQKMFAGSATRLEKMMFQKYLFKNMFCDVAHIMALDVFDNPEPINALEYAWNENYGYFFKQVRRLLENPKNIFSQLQQANGWPSIFPIDIRKTTIPPDVKDQIFREFKFKFVHPKSSVPKIIEQVYNSYFMRRIIHTDYKDKNEHVSYSVVEQPLLEFYYAFCSNYIKPSISNPDICSCCKHTKQNCSCNTVIQQLVLLADSADTTDF